MLTSGILKKISDSLYLHRFYFLLAGLLVNFFIPPLVYLPLIQVFFKIFTTVILLMSGANFIQKGKTHLRNLWFVFGFINIVVAVFSELNPENVILSVTRFLLLFAFFFVITVSLLQQIFSIKNVTHDVIIGSFCGYLLIGIFSFFTFSLINYADSDAFSGLSTEPTQRLAQIFYFTFTCLTTLGFGDILPVNLFAQKLSVLTASVGQFYIAVIVAILVSRFMNQRNN